MWIKNVPSKPADDDLYYEGKPVDSDGLTAEEWESEGYVGLYKREEFKPDDFIWFLLPNGTDKEDGTDLYGLCGKVLARITKDDYFLEVSLINVDDVIRVPIEVYRTVVSLRYLVVNISNFCTKKLANASTIGYTIRTDYIRKD